MDVAEAAEVEVEVLPDQLREAGLAVAHIVHKGVPLM